jgi:hypothetical protein
VAWRAIVIASLSNLVFKSAAILLIAGWRSLAPFALAALAVGAAGGALLIWW